MRRNQQSALVHSRELVQQSGHSTLGLNRRHLSLMRQHPGAASVLHLRKMPGPPACSGWRIHPQAERLGLKLAPDVRSSFDQGEAFVDPAGSTPYHLFYGPSELSKTNTSFVRPVAVRARAVDDKYCFW